MLSCLFPGQGSQTPGMGADLFEAYPDWTRLADEVLGYSILELCLRDPERNLNRTQYTQPAIYVVNALAYRRRLESGGRPPDFLAGHSLGEINALQAAGGFGYETGLRIVKRRGELMATAPKGAMAAVLRLPEDGIRKCLADHGLEDIDIANFNSPSQIVVSGLEASIRKAQEAFQEAGAVCIPLNTGGAFHSRYMEPAAREFEGFLAGLAFGPLGIPVIGNGDAAPYRHEDIAANLARQLTRSVQWSRTMEFLLDRGVREFVELGAGDVLTKLLKANREHYIASGKGKVPEKTVTASSPGESAAASGVSGKTAASPDNYSMVTADVLSLNVNRRGRIAEVHHRVEEWNRSHPVGSRVHVAGWPGTLTTRTRALVLFGERAAVYMDGHEGYFDLDPASLREVAE